MTRIVLAELLGGRVFELDDLDASSLTPVGGDPLGGPSGPAVHSGGAVLAAAMRDHAIALAEPGGAWQRFGSRGSGEGEFERPAATAFLGDALIVLDTGNCRVVALDDIDGNGWTAYGRP